MASPIQENLSSLLNIELLRGRLANPQTPRDPVKLTSLALPVVTGKPLPMAAPFAAVTPMPSVTEGIPVHEMVGGLHTIFELLLKDVMATRDRLLALNPGRRTMIERRLEFIARKVARVRGERFNRTLSLTEILKESFRDETSTEETKTLGLAAWSGFAAEVALYHVLELFFLKSLDFHGWRKFEPSDLGRMNFAAHSFLNQHATDFNMDKHCWNFVRSNLYSWHVPSSRTLTVIVEVLEKMTLSWSDQDLMNWVSRLPHTFKLGHLEFAQEFRVADTLVRFLENDLNVPLVSRFQGQPVCKKVFIPALEMGSVALSILDRFLRFANGAFLSLEDNLKAQQMQLQRAVWACESESLEVFWTEVVALLKTLRWSGADKALVCPLPGSDFSSHYRLPHVVHAVQMLGLELHNLEQLPLGGPEICKLHQGSAGQIQQLETFDIALVTDHPDRSKSGRWMSALASQLPYWRNLVGSSTNLNWGELHLYLAMSKLKENGYCLYLSHRVLPEGGDGDKLRKSLLSLGAFEYFLELDETANSPYRYLYVFRRVENKTERDGFRPRFGKLRKGMPLTTLEEANSTQVEIAERGWDHLFVRGAAPLVRHLNHKFPKLFQLASLQSGDKNEPAMPGFTQLKSSGGASNALKIQNIEKGLRFLPAGQGQDQGLLIFPHNPIDVPWVECLLNSPAAQFWIRHQILAPSSGKHLKLQDLRSTPIVDLAHAPTDAVHDAMAWMGHNPVEETLYRQWACDTSLPLTERQARFVALAKRFCTAEKLVERYSPLFGSGGARDEEMIEIKAEAITQFYPERLISLLSQSPEVRIQYAGRERSSLMPENWVLAEAHVVLQQNSRHACLVAQTRQGPTLQILVPSAVQKYVLSQLQALKDHTWGEALSMLRIPKDIALFTAQTTEIIRVVNQTRQEMRVYKRVLDEMSLDLFEIAHDMRPFLTT